MKTEKNETEPLNESEEESILEKLSLELLDELESEFEQLKLEGISPLEKSKIANQTIFKSSAQLRNLLAEHPFESPALEINFFKTIKPRVYRWQIYFSSLYTIESSVPITGADSQIAYFSKELDHIARFYQQYVFQYEYYKLGATELDSYYFLRAVETPSTIMPVLQEPDSCFSTCLDHLVAKFMAYEMVRGWLINKITYLMKNPHASISMGQKNTEKRWTDNKVDLVELAYAVHARGSIDRGKADVKQVIEIFENAFNIDLGNYYGVFTQNIRLRKKNRTVFIDQLKENLERRMTELDE